MKDNGVICMLPWVHTTVSMKNTLRPCCRFRVGREDEGITADSESDIKDKFRWLRTEMLAGRPVEKCSLCYQQGDKSMKWTANKEFDLENAELTEDFDKLRSVELSLDNLCNLQCKMCDSLFSSKLYDRDKYLIEVHNLKGRNPTKIPKQRIEFLKGLDIDWHALEHIKILGGEPFFSPNFPKLIDFLLEHSEVKNVTLEIVSNCTNRLDQDMIDKLNQFGFIILTCSLDGCNEFNTYQRWGSPGWEETLDTYKWYHTVLNNMVKKHIHSTYTILNLSGLANDMKYWENNHPDWSVSFNFVTTGEYSPYVVPTWYTDWILKQWGDTKGIRIDLAKKMFKENQIKYKPWKTWGLAMLKLQAIDDYYDSSLGDYCPELEMLLLKHDKTYQHNQYYETLEDFNYGM